MTDCERVIPEEPRCDICGLHDSRLVEGACEWCRQQYSIQKSTAEAERANG